MRLKDSSHPALTGGRTIFLKSVKPPEGVKRLLQPASTNRKLGGGKTTITKGRWRGMPLYQLLLEERKTCPRTCAQWANCYGNNMYLARRIDHTAPTFYSSLSAELSALASAHSSGFVVRLHVLGDFFSTKYVSFWSKALRIHPSLRIFGYTHRYPEHADGIGRAVEKLNQSDRCWIRFSDRGGDMSANLGTARGTGDIQCPQEVGKTESCLTCGLCWQTKRAIGFLEH